MNNHDLHTQHEPRALAETQAARAEAAAARFAFLAEASQVLSSSLDYEQTLRDIAQLAVPTLGDMCIVDVLEDGHLRRVAASHVNAGKAELLEQLRVRYPVTADSPQPAGRVLRSGRPELLGEVDAAVVASHARDKDHADLIQALGMRSHVAVPLVARGVAIGVISVGITESSRRYGPEDLAYTQDLAQRAALAVDNARLYGAAQQEIIERRRAEAALRISAGRFRAVMDESPLSIQILGDDGRTLMVNKAWETLWGLTLAQVADYNVLADPQLEVLGILPFLRRAFQGEAVEIPAACYDPEETLPGRSQHHSPARWVRAFAYPVKDNAEGVREVVLVHEDVSARMVAAEKLRASEERLRLALMASRMNVWEWDLQTDKIECSEGAREFWGIEVGQASDFLRVVHPDDLNLLSEAASKATASGESYNSEYRLVCPGGPIRWVQSRGRVERTAKGEAKRLFGVTIDITDLKAAEEATRILADAGATLNASLNYQVTLENLAQVVVPRLADWCAVDLLNEQGDLERVTVRHTDSGRTLLGKALFNQFPPRPSDEFGAMKVLRTGEPEWAAEITDEALEATAYNAEHLRLLRDLKIRSAIVVPLLSRNAAIGVLSLVHAESGRQYRAADVELAKDLARRAASAVDNARLYQQLRTEDRRKDEFLATLAHELRNPLAPIRAGLEVMRMAGPETPTARTREIMERQLGHMVRLIDDLLDVSRVTRGKVQLRRQHLELSSVINSALEASRPIIEAARLRLEVNMSSEPIGLQADPTRLSQVLSNVLNNAAKYTEPGGLIEVASFRDGNHAVITVKDGGVGIPHEMLNQVFEMFVQVGRSLDRSQGGLGIGLTLVKRLVELHGGHVWADSEGPGRGSKFTIRLPADEALAAPSTNEPARQPAPSARRVLVVDDNEDAAEMMAALLSLQGHDVRTAGDGHAALEVLTAFRPQVAILDIGLPGMSGYELARRFRADVDGSAITLIALTGWGQAEDRRNALEAGFDYHLTKPVSPQAVMALIT